MRVLIIAALSFVVYSSALACSSAIVSESRSAERGVILWKHRDSDIHDTCIHYLTTGKYPRIVLTPSYSSIETSMLSGLNEAGLAIITTRTNNIFDRKTVLSATEEAEIGEMKYSVLARALSECATVDEVEQYFRSTPRPRYYQLNLACGDATGNAAYFEIGCDSYRRYDVSERSEGFDVRTNFSFIGDMKRAGSSIRRYSTVMDEMTAHAGKFSVRDMIGYSRSYYSEPYGYDILEDDRPYKDASYCVPRYSSVACIVIVCGPDARMIVSDGHPETAMPMTAWVAAKGRFPKGLRPGGDVHRLSREYVAKAYTVSGRNRYLNKDVVRRVHAIPQPYLEQKTMPEDLDEFNRMQDEVFASYAIRVRKALMSFK